MENKQYTKEEIEQKIKNCRKTVERIYGKEYIFFMEKLKGMTFKEQLEKEWKKK